MANPFGTLGRVVVSTLGAPAAITVETRTGLSNTGGFRTTNTVTSRTVNAHVQPLTPKEIEQLPELESTREAVWIFTVERLQVSDVASQNPSDQVIWDGRTYRLVHLEDWTAQARYAKHLAIRVGP